LRANPKTEKKIEKGEEEEKKVKKNGRDITQFWKIPAAETTLVEDRMKMLRGYKTPRKLITHPSGNAETWGCRQGGYH